MQILREELTYLNITKKGLAIALGTFDGVHNGHTMLLNRLIEIAKEKDLNTLVYTFDNQPLNVLYGDDKVKFIMTLKEREEAISKLPLDYLYIKHFDKKYADITCEQFIKNLLNDFPLKHVVVGFNFTFGLGAKGNAKTLKDQLEKKGVEVTILQPILSGKIPISSSYIRDLIANGDMESANVLLGQPYSIESNVIEGRRIGNTLGFPTANINYDTHKILPRTGIYITKTTVDEKIIPSITNVGYNPTVKSSEHKLKIETYLLDYTGTLYGEEIKVDFLTRIRDEKTFDSFDLLKAQIAKDVDAAREYFHIIKP